MTGPERRQHPRTALQTFAYVNLGANNYGSVLNISETGLSFRSVAPVVKNRTVRFWFSEHSHRIEAIGEVAWTDETQKTGGLRFTTLSAEAREQVRHWISNPSVLQDPSALAGPTTGSALASTGFIQPGAGAAPSVQEWAVSRKLKVKLRMTGFTGGLAIGLMIAALVAGGFVFQNYRREFGESLIRVGERFAAKPQAQAPSAELAPTQAAQPAPEPSPSPRAAALAPVPAAVIERTETSQPKPLAILPQAAPAKLESTALTTTAAAIVTAQPSPAASAPGPGDSASKKTTNTPAIALPPPAISLPSGARIAASNMIPGKVDVAPPVPPTTPTPSADSGRKVTEVSNGAAKAGPPPEMFLEVGKFKDQGGAHRATEQLSQLGFPATVHQKSRLWSNSYLVLVGPFGDEEKAAAASHDLVARDFRPRPFERGSHDITFRNGLTLNGTHVPEGDCTVRWESYITDTVVKILQDNLLVTTASGQWVKTPTKYRRDAFVVRRNPDGTRTLLEIQFGGFAKTLVFNKPS